MSNSSSQSGLTFAISAYAMWGIAPIYFKLLEEVSASMILVHRIVWSVLVLALIVIISQRHRVLVSVMRQPKSWALLALTGLLLSANWLLFIWAVNQHYMLEASLGYFINPLFNVLLGYLFLNERLQTKQWWAVVLAGLSVLYLLISVGQLPWIALVLASSFGLYGLIRKSIPVDPVSGLLIETLILLPFALLYWFFFSPAIDSFSAQTEFTQLLLLAAGVVTTAPLLCFNAAAKRLKYSTLGFIQYIGPSIMFLLAIFYYAEPLDSERLITFMGVWAALLLYTLDSYQRYRQQVRVKSAN